MSKLIRPKGKKPFYSTKPQVVTPSKQIEKAVKETKPPRSLDFSVKLVARLGNRDIQKSCLNWLLISLLIWFVNLETFAAKLILSTFALFGLFTLFRGYRFSSKALKLLQTGKLTTATLQKQQPIKRYQINRQRPSIFDLCHMLLHWALPPSKLYFAFKNDRGKQLRARIITRNPAKLMLKEEVSVVFDIDRPENNLILESLPGKIRIDENNEIARGHWWHLLKAAILPLLLISSNIWYFYHWVIDVL